MARNIVSSQDVVRDLAATKSGQWVVLYSDEHEVRVLRYSIAECCWYVTGHQSVCASSGNRIAGADFYFKGIGYIGSSFMAYGMLDDSSVIEDWHRLYNYVQSQPSVFASAMLTFLLPGSDEAAAGNGQSPIRVRQGS